MGVLFGLTAAAFWGAADFLARLATERVGTRRTVFWMQLIAMGCTGALLAWPAARPPSPTAGAIAAACGIGLLNVLGASMLYRALEIGTVSLVSPVSSTFAAITAALAIAFGERPTAVQLAGLAVTAAGVVGAAIPPTRQDAGSASRRGLGLAALAAVTWGVAFFALKFVVGPLGSLFPVFVSRVVATLVMALASLIQRQPLTPPRGALGFIAGIAVFDSIAFAAYNLGITGSLTAVVSILSSLFSAVTIVLAYAFLRERLGRLQWAAVVVILSGVALVSSGG